MKRGIFFAGAALAWSVSGAAATTTLLESTAGLGYGSLADVPASVDYTATIVSGAGVSYSITIPGVVPFNDAILEVPAVDIPSDFLASLTNGTDDRLTIVHMFGMFTIVQLGWESAHLIAPEPGQNDLQGKTIEGFVFEACGDEQSHRYDFTVRVVGPGGEPPVPPGVPEPSRALLGGLSLAFVLLQRRRPRAH